MKRYILVISLGLLLISWSCSKENSQPRGLKDSVTQSATEINTAVNKIAESKGFQILSSRSAAVSKSMTSELCTGTDSITLSLIAGIYDYQFDTLLHPFHMEYPFSLFKKTGTSDNMIVNLPHNMIFNPWYLHNSHSADTVKKNDFKITTTDYHLYYSLWNSLDYKITAGLAQNLEDLGNFSVSALSKSFSDHSYSSSFNFADGYGISTSWQTGDTTKSVFSLTKDKNTLLKETSLFVKTDSHSREKLYDLIIGNVEIKKGYADSIQVYLNGTLQKTAGVKITDGSETTGTICGKRDIQITYDDGTTTTLSTLISPVIDDLKTLVESLHDMYFAENVINYIAINIYYTSR